MFLPVCHTKWKMSVKKARNATLMLVVRTLVRTAILIKKILEACFDEPIADDVWLEDYYTEGGEKTAKEWQNFLELKQSYNIFFASFVVIL